MNSWALSEAAYTLKNRRKAEPDMPIGGGIYAIQHQESGRCYVGQTTVFSMRVWEHLKALRQGRHKAPLLQEIFSASGEDAFRFKVVQQMWQGYGPSHDQAERFWIRQYGDSVGVLNCQQEINRAHSCPSRLERITQEQGILLKKGTHPNGVTLGSHRNGYTLDGVVFGESVVKALWRGDLLIPIHRVAGQHITFTTSLLAYQFLKPVTPAPQAGAEAKGGEE